MALRQLHELMLGSQDIKIFRSNYVEPEYSGYNSSIPDDIMNDEIDFLVSSKEYDRIIIILK